MDSSFEQALTNVWRQTLVENADVVELGTERSCSADSQAPFAASGLRVRRERDSWAGAEPGNEITVGANGTGWQKSDAVLERGPPSGECG
jgi:hypothetical protein